ncbi:deoxyribodipyrimidine photo-lyase [Vibrio europaeus]|uniref:deoxyribodipyrimidine photo-lyase n=1 Tax=Vibrio europaeus TaxID=300876 RepID=UPI00233F3E2D|nr:deoxyribodipyrimidine photo-lyase [Vibrio europaeus]MDC5805931.1 deoxyribodipyrimidine photo-lyase [Vibrio europaeus]MDC5825997.1 deoxyribodipyrimidine photo-lyase [Vibrio europaeus]MDC5831360.1 deoxyribodipyrimidine photo-lyase [Vibrio europaeus]MDC5834316.1 deoxyribodipyrimidine photo-lyase [Vibrio europaeus]
MKIVWLRRDLRVEDNTALNCACSRGEPVVALYIATPQTWQEHSLAPIQADLIYRRLLALQSDLSKKNISLYYAQTDSFKDAARLVAEVALKEGASGVYLNKEYELNELGRDELLSDLLATEGIDCKSIDDKCILNPGSVVNKQGHYFKVFTPFKRAYLAAMYRQPVAVTKLNPQQRRGKLISNRVAEFSSQCDFDYPRESSERYAVDTEQIIQALRSFDSDKVDSYHSHRDFPAIDGTSALSPYLAIGALSVRQCMARLMYQQILPLSGGREVWQSELIWREFYQHLAYYEPKLSQGKSFTSWGDNLVWLNPTAAIDAWKKGLTGYPIVDAAMRQLNQTGWMHNRLRMIVASFLVKDLHVDWRVGEHYFMSKLVDGDYAANNGGWQWCASTGCDGQPYFRIFNPTTQGERFDPDGAFIRRWIPELLSVPDKHIHQPHKWGNAKDLSYPEPIVDHKTEREITLSLYKEAKEV